MGVTLFRGMVAGLLALAALLLAAPAASAEEKPWEGVVGPSQANVRSAPSTAAPKVDVLEPGRPITVAGWVTGEEVEPTNNSWAQLGDGRFVYSSTVRRPRPDSPPPVPGGVQYEGKWIDVNVTQQLLTAYEGDTPVRLMVISSGRPEYPTPMGTFTILKRVYNETMDSASLPWVRDSYDLKDVLFTQYFNEYGAALHLAYWKSEDSFGIPTSHGCVGMPYAEAEWIWNWAAVGVPLYIHP